MLCIELVSHYILQENHCIVGSESQVQQAVNAITERFPSHLYPNVNYDNIAETTHVSQEPLHINLTQVGIFMDAMCPYGIVEVWVAKAVLAVSVINGWWHQQVFPW